MTKSFIKDTAVMASAPLVIQATSLFLVPIIARIYSPQYFGEFGIFNAIFSTMLTFATLDYANAIMVARGDREKLAVAGLALTICIVGVVLLGCVYVLLVTMNLVPEGLIIWQWAFLGFLLYVLHGVYSTLRYRCLDLGLYSVIAGSSIAQFLSNNLTVLVWPLFFATSAYGLIFGSVLGVIFQCLVLACFLLFYFKKPLAKFHPESMSRAAINYRQFPFFSVPSNLISRASVDVPILILAFYFNEEQLGFYLMAFRLLNMPLSLLSSSIGEVFYSRDSNSPSGELQLLENIFSFLCFVGFLPLLMVSMFGRELFSFLLGEQWAFSGELIKCLALLTLVKFIFTPVHFVAVRLELQNWTFVANLLLTLSQLGGMVYGGYLGDLALGLLVGSVLGSACWIVYSFFILRSAGLSLNYVLRRIFEETCLCGLMLLGIFFLQFYLTGSLLVAAIIGFALAFFIVRVIVTQEFSSAVLPYVRRKN